MAYGPAEPCCMWHMLHFLQFYFFPSPSAPPHPTEEDSMKVIRSVCVSKMSVFKLFIVLFLSIWESYTVHPQTPAQTFRSSVWGLPAVLGLDYILHGWQIFQCYGCGILDLSSAKPLENLLHINSTFFLHYSMSAFLTVLTCVLSM